MIRALIALLTWAGRRLPTVQHVVWIVGLIAEGRR